MKKLIVLLSFGLLMTMEAAAQNITVKDGLYYAGNSLYTGTYASADAKGKTKASYSIVDGKANGAVTYYYENGTIMETGAFVNNEKSGEWLRWDEKGNKIGQAFYVMGKKNGTWMVWDMNGTKRYEMNYAMGEKTGTWKMWDENGVLTSEKNYSAS